MQVGCKNTASAGCLFPRSYIAQLVSLNFVSIGQVVQMNTSGRHGLCWRCGRGMQHEPGRCGPMSA
jgi:hypothetical protein